MKITTNYRLNNNKQLPRSKFFACEGFLIVFQSERRLRELEHVKRHNYAHLILLYFCYMKIREIRNKYRRNNNKKLPRAKLFACEGFVIVF